jgi:hypothetical protein
MLGVMAKTWEGTAGSTDFVITTVNVPDRLDVQEVRAREDEDDDRTERFWIDWYAIRTWVVRVLMIGLIVGAGLFAWESTQPLRADLSPERIAERLAQATGQPVKVGGTDFRFTPTPRFVISDLEVGKVWRTNAITLHFNWEDAWRAVRGGGWIWGEASVGAIKIGIDQAEFLLRVLPRLSTALPSSISTVRFEAIEFQGVRELPGAFEGLIRRNAEGSFGAITLKNADGSIAFSATPPGVAESVGVQFDATNWRATVGPSIVWNEVHASIRARPGLIEIPEFLLAGFFGSVKGSAYAASDVHWVVTGNATGTNLDIEAILRQAAGSKVTDESNRRQMPLAGTAAFDLLLAGHGPSLGEAIDATVASGPVRVRWATLHGINLGYAASRPGSQSGGITRFTDLTGWVSAGPAGTSFQDLDGRAGALATRGEVAVGTDQRLSGSLRVDLGGARVQAPLNLQLRGNLLAPEFGR